MKISRRSLLLSMAAAPIVLRAQRGPARPKLAAVCTTYFKYSHAQHIVDRFLEGYGWNGTHHHPPMDLVSIYIDQIREDDVSKAAGNCLLSDETGWICRIRGRPIYVYEV